MTDDKKTDMQPRRKTIRVGDGQASIKLDRKTTGWPKASDLMSNREIRNELEDAFSEAFEEAMYRGLND